MAWLSADFDSKVLHMPTSVDILMPQGHGNYKTIYLLHGAGGDKTTWLLKSRIADYVEGKNVAVIMPSGNNSFYVNQNQGKNYMDYISQELPELCESWFSLSGCKQDRMIAGMSMGGYGAFVNALNNPEVFGYAASFSGLLDVLQRYDRPQGLDMQRVFGEREALIKSKNDLFYMTEQCKNDIQYLIMCGEQDNRLKMNEEMYTHMKSHSYLVKMEKSEGKHDFDYWDQCIKKAIEWFMQESEVR